MAEHLRENNAPLNQAAKRWLPTSEPILAMELYVLQLAQEAVDQQWPDRVVPAATRHLLDQGVSGLMTNLQPRQAMRFLARDPDDAEGESLLDDLTHKLEQAPSMQEAGSAVLEWIAVRLQRHNPALETAGQL